MRAKKVLSGMVCIVMLTTIFAVRTGAYPEGWGDDIRLTYASGNSALPAVAIDSNDNIYVVWQDDRDGTYDIYLKKSTDYGKTWNSDIKVTDTNSQSGWPSISIDSKDVLHLLWLKEEETKANWQPYDDDYKQILYKNSADGGNTWSSEVQIASYSGQTQGPSNLDIAVGKDDTLHVAYSKFPPSNIYYRNSTDGGGTWSTPKIIGNEQDCARIVVIVADSKGHVYVAFDGWGDMGDIQFVKSDDNGDIWSSETTLVDGPSWANHAQLAATDDGHVFLVYCDNLGVGTDPWNDPHEIYIMISHDNAQSWGSGIRLTNDYNRSAWPTIALDSQNNAHIVWYDDRDGNWEIYYIKVDSDGKTLIDDTRLTDDPATSASPVIAIDTMGIRHVFWQDNRAMPGNYEIYYKGIVLRPTAEAGQNQTVDEGGAVQFNGSGYFDIDWRKLDVNFATDSALYLRTIDPTGPYGGGWEGGVREWVTFNSTEPFWIGKKAGHLGQGPTGYEYTYYWKMHRNGNFNLSFRAANGYYYVNLYDATNGTYIVSGLYVHESLGDVVVVRQLNKGHIYRLDIYDTYTSSGFPNDLDVLFHINETDILLTPDLDSLVYYVTEDPLYLAFEGQGVTEITFYSRGLQEFFVFNTSPLNHSEVEISEGELTLAPPPYNTGITPGEYNDTIADIGGELNYTWDFDANVDSNGDGNATNDIDATGPTQTHTYGDDGIYTVTLTVSANQNLSDKDTMQVIVNNVAPTILPFGPFTTSNDVPLNLVATATDPGSDDLTFAWSWGDGTSDTTTVYYNDGMGPDPYPSPWGTFPFSEIDTVQHTYGNAGVYTINLTVEDDDGGVTIYSTNVTVIHVAPPVLCINASQDGGDVILSWDPPSTLGIDYYLIYRSTSQTGFDFNTIWVNTSKDNESGEPGPIPLRTMWNDTKAALPGDPNYEEQYYYIMRAVNVLGKVSSTSRTVGKWTKTFPSGVSTFSLPLEPLENITIDYCLSDMNASFIKWMNQTTHTWMKHGDGVVNDTQVEVGNGYEVKFGNQTNYTFTGMPGAMIMYDDDTGFLGFDPYTEARNLTATVNPFTGNVTLNWTKPSSKGVNNQYHVLRSIERDGFWAGNYVQLATLPFDKLTYTDVGNATAGSQYYYMIVPVNETGVEGASTYSIGIWTEEYLSQYDTFGIPLKQSSNQSADWYCDNVPDTVGINYYNVSAQRWCWHSKRMPSGAFDPILVMTEGYQISTSNDTKFTFIGI